MAAVQTVERRLFEHLRSRIEEPGLSGVLTREGRARQEREAERGVRAVCSVGALPGGMGVRLPRQHYVPAPGFTIHYERTTGSQWIE